MSAKIKTIFKKTISKKNKRKNKRIIQCNNLRNNQCKTKRAKISSDNNLDKMELRDLLDGKGGPDESIERKIW